jgi:hypothetical protein
MDERVVGPTGLEVILTEQCWSGHIVAHHPEMASFKARVVETIRAPDAIYQAKRDPSRRAYARKYAHVPGVGNELTLLVFADTGDRYVATSYFAAYRFRPLGGQIWPSS